MGLAYVGGLALYLLLYLPVLATYAVVILVERKTFFIAAR